MLIIIKAIPPSNNEFIGRKNIWEYQRQKQAWQWLVRAGVKKKPEKPYEKSIVRITYFFPDKIRRDPDNYSGKFILDGLKHSGVILDDSFSHIKLELDGDIDRENPRTEIEILEVKYGR